MKSTIDSFKDGIDKAFTTQPNVKLNSDTMMDAQKYKSSFVEEIDSDGNEYETFLEKNKKSKNSAKNQFTKDIAKDRDYIGFKKGAEYKDEKVKFIVLEHLMRQIMTHLLRKKNTVELVKKNLKKRQVQVLQEHIQVLYLAKEVTMMNFGKKVGLKHQD